VRYLAVYPFELGLCYLRLFAQSLEDLLISQAVPVLRCESVVDPLVCFPCGVLGVCVFWLVEQLQQCVVVRHIYLFIYLFIYLYVLIFCGCLFLFSPSAVTFFSRGDRMDVTGLSPQV
jgi:hypothetical protein